MKKIELEMSEQYSVKFQVVYTTFQVCKMKIGRIATRKNNK